jgi:hypothetical protein
VDIFPINQFLDAVAGKLFDIRGEPPIQSFGISSFYGEL